MSSWKGWDGTEMEGRIDFRLAPTARAPAEARGAVERLAPNLHPEESEALKLLVSELVTNSVRHAGLDPGGWIDVAVHLRPGSVRVAVTDPGPGFEPPAEQPHPGRSSGWGLFLVQRVADRWGVEADDVTQVWAELRRAG
jgi:anti-sigma regulatory factor (Ser/Thr protein kinase)